jgi:hypothetical protein
MGECFSKNSEKNIAVNLVSSDGMELKKLSEIFRKDKDVVMAAIKQNPLSLQFASPEIRKDPKIMCIAVSKNNKSLKFINIIDENYVAKEDEEAFC